MAGDWIKIEHALPDKPEVFAIAEQLGIDPDTVVGKLVRFWSWCDQQFVNGNALTVTENVIDRITHQPGFSVALRKVDWLQARSGSLAVPNFDRHNGQSSKARAVTNRRVAEHREKSNAPSVTNVTPRSLQKPLPEKRREEKKEIPPNPPADPFAGMSETRKATFETWLRYKAERGQKYKPTGLKALITEHSKLSDTELSAAVQSSMASNYTGIFPPKGPGPATASGRVFRNPDGTTFVSEKNY